MILKSSDVSVSKIKESWWIILINEFYFHRTYFWYVVTGKKTLFVDYFLNDIWSFIAWALFLQMLLKCLKQDQRLKLHILKVKEAWRIIFRTLFFIYTSFCFSFINADHSFFNIKFEFLF